MTLRGVMTPAMVGVMTDSYYRDRILRTEADAENARAARMAALDEALRAVLRDDSEVMEDGEFDILSDAAGVVSRLHAIW